MSTKQSVLKLVFVTIVFSLALIACQPTSTETPAATNAPAPTAKPQDTEVAISTATPTAEPIPSGPSEGLVSIQDNEYVPALAASWTVSEDGLDYIFELRSGAVFTDGTPVNADAVVANFNHWFDPQDPTNGYAPWAAAFGGFKGETDDSGKPKSSFDGAEKVDNFTVLIHLNRPFSDLLTTLAQPDFVIVSPASFK